MAISTLPIEMPPLFACFNAVTLLITRDAFLKKLRKGTLLSTGILVRNTFSDSLLSAKLMIVLSFAVSWSVTEAATIIVLEGGASIFNCDISADTLLSVCMRSGFL